jgi:hypothetical protein
LALFGRRPPQRVDSLLMPASENLHKSRHRQYDRSPPKSATSRLNRAFVEGSICPLIHYRKQVQLGVHFQLNTVGNSGGNVFVKPGEHR